MSYYRAALAAARSGDLTSAERLVRASLASGENAPNAPRLQELLRRELEARAAAPREGALRALWRRIRGGRA